MINPRMACQSTSSRLIFLCMVLLMVNVLPIVAADEPRQWQTTSIIKQNSLEISISKPRLVTRSSGYLWFPTMTRLSGGELFANFSTNRDEIVPDRTSSVSWSGDNGLTWSTPSSIKPTGDLYAETIIRQKNGDAVLLPFNLFPEKDQMQGWYQVVSGKRDAKRVQFFDKSLTVSGFPRPSRSFNTKLGLSGFGFNGQSVIANTGEFLATMYGYFQGDSRYSLVMVDSTDGKHWKFRSVISGADCKLAGSEGPCESATVRLKDGRLMNIFRLASGVPYGQTFSLDDGRTWSDPVAMKEAHSVQPSLAVMPEGSLVLTGGRPGIFAWINQDGTGRDWVQVDLQSHHNAQQISEQITPGRTTSYTEVEPLDDHSVIVMYDRIPFGWGPIPIGSDQTNSIWVVRVSWNKL